jgi:hypothetical protein
MFGAHNDAFCHGLHAGFRREEHIVVTNHQNDMCWLKAIATAVVKTPKNVLGFVSTDSDVGGFQAGKVFFPSISPLDSDAVTDEQYVDGTGHFPYGFHVGRVEF